jgi:hypothetical protein
MLVLNQRMQEGRLDSLDDASSCVSNVNKNLNRIHWHSHNDKLNY